MSERPHETNWDGHEPVELIGAEHLVHLDDDDFEDDDEDEDWEDDDLDFVDMDFDGGPLADLTRIPVPDLRDAAARAQMPDASRSVLDDPSLLAELAGWTRTLIRVESPGVWCFAAVDRESMTDVIVPIAVGGVRPVRDGLDRVFAEFREGLDADGILRSLVIAIVRSDGGDRGSYERLWHTAVTAAATRHRVPLRAVAALGSRRASLL